MRARVRLVLALLALVLAAAGACVAGMVIGSYIVPPRAVQEIGDRP